MYDEVDPTNKCYNVVMEQEIIKYLIAEYDPEVILCAGSRVRGTHSETSDWDLFLLGSKKGKPGFVNFNENILDISLKLWPEENNSLTIPYGPLWPVKVLLDNSNGILEKVLSKTESDFLQGPMVLYKDACFKRFEKLKSCIRKIERYRNNPLIEFYYAGVFYELSIRSWFEFQNKWPLPPGEAIPHIKENATEFFELLNSFISINSLERFKIANLIMAKIKT